jgi:hypothetical protein
MIIKSCLRCGRRYFRAGRAFQIHCAEGRAVAVSICRACAKVCTFRPAAARPVEVELRRAA